MVWSRSALMTCSLPPRAYGAPKVWPTPVVILGAMEPRSSRALPVVRDADACVSPRRGEIRHGSARYRAEAFRAASPDARTTRAGPTEVGAVSVGLPREVDVDAAPCRSAHVIRRRRVSCRVGEA